MVKREHPGIDLTADERAGEPVAQMARVEEPDHLLCPITHVMFRDPVVLLGSGNTYEREAIERHLESSDIDPRSNVKIQSKQLVTNRAIRHAVGAWLDENPGITPDGWDTRGDILTEDGVEHAYALTFVNKVKRTANDFVFSQFLELIRWFKSGRLNKDEVASELIGILGRYPELYIEMREKYFPEVDVSKYLREHEKLSQELVKKHFDNPRILFGGMEGAERRMEDAMEDMHNVLHLENPY